MDKFSTLLLHQFDASLAENFDKQASYYRTMDFLEYVSEDTTVVADRIDDFLTILWAADDRRLIGFRLKGFGCAFREHIQPVLKLKPQDFDPIVFALQRYFTEVGNSITADGAGSSERETAYKYAMDLADRDHVSLPPDFATAA